MADRIVLNPISYHGHGAIENYNGPRFSDQGSKKEREHGMMKKR